MNVATEDAGAGSGTTLGNIAFSLAMRGIGMASTLGMAVVTARALGFEGRGLYVLPQLDASIALALFTGLSGATSHFLLRLGKSRNSGSMIVRATFIVALAGAALSAAIAVIQHQPWAALPAAGYAAMMAPLNTIWGYWLGRHRPRAWSVWFTLPTALSFAAIAATLVFAPTAGAAILALLAATAATLLCAIGFALIDWRSQPASERAWPGVTAYALRAGSANVVSLLNYRVALFIIAALTSISLLGQYSLAVSGCEMVLAIAQTIAFTITPRIGSLDASEASREVARASRSLVLAMTIVCAVSALAAPLAVRIVLGSAYLGIVTPLRILLAGTLALSSGTLLASYFTINRGRPEIPLAGSISAVLVGAIAGYALIPRFGMSGGALATSGAFVIGQSVLLFFFWRDAGIDPRKVLIPNRRDVVDYAGIITASIARVRTVFP